MGVQVISPAQAGREEEGQESGLWCHTIVYRSHRLTVHSWAETWQVGRPKEGKCF